MQTVQISADEYARLVRSETTMEGLDIYINSTEYNDIKYIRSLIKHAMNYLPFTVPAEPKMPESFQSVGVNPEFKDEPEIENDWEE